MRRCLILLLTLAGCAEQPTEPPPFGHTVERWSDLDHFHFADNPISAAKQLSTHQWAKDRYQSGLEIEWDIRDRTIRESPVMRQALNLVADTLYAIVLPSKGIRTLEVYVDVDDLSDSDGDDGWTVATGGGVFWVSGPQRGLPVSGDVGIVIDENELEDTHDKPLYISSLDHWYMVLMHEALHVLGFGVSPTWDGLITTSGYDRFVCGTEILGGHWYSPSYEGPGRLLMFTYLSSSRVLIGSQTLCALDGIGWDIRRASEGSAAPDDSDAEGNTPDVAPEDPQTPDTGDHYTIEKPNNLELGFVASSSARIKWDPVSGASGYDVRYMELDGGDWQTQPHEGLASFNTLAYLSSGATYKWAVRAKNRRGTSPWAYGPRFTTKE